MTTPDAFLVQRMGSEEGPYSLQDLATQARAGVLKANTMVKRADGTGSWFLATELPGVFSDKDWLATLLISFFVGWFGIDRFYLGYTGTGHPQAHHLRRLRHLVPRGPDPHRDGQARRLRASTAPPDVIDRRAVAAVLVAGAVVLPGALLRGSPVICPFRRVTGLPCPACGLTRSWQAAAHLRLGDSLGYHPLGAATFLGAVAIALDERDGVPRLTERRDVQLSAGALWVAAWLWRLRRSSAA